MNLLINIIKMVLPVLVMIWIGYLCKKKGILTEEGKNGLKAVIGNVTLPVVLFKAFFTAEYNKKIVIVFCIMYLCYTAAIGLGFIFKRLASPYENFMPFLVTSAEGGMLGYALFGLLAGNESTSVFAVADIGQTMFAYTIFLILLKKVDRQVNKKTEKGESIWHIFIHNKACIGMTLGILLGAFGLGNRMEQIEAGQIVMELLEFISAPTGGMILIIVGYELSFHKKLIKPVIKTTIIRFAIMGVLFLAASKLIFLFIPFDKNLNMALMLIFSLPAPFIISLFADVGEDGEYISTTLSVGTLLAIVLFSGIAVYSI